MNNEDRKFRNVREQIRREEERESYKCTLAAIVLFIVVATFVLAVCIGCSVKVDVYNPLRDTSTERSIVHDRNQGQESNLARFNAWRAENENH